MSIEQTDDTRVPEQKEMVADGVTKTRKSEGSAETDSIRLTEAQWIDRWNSDTMRDTCFVSSILHLIVR